MPDPARCLLRAARSTNTTTPGRQAIRLSTPYTTATVSPCDAPSPTEPNATAVTPSRGPQPPTLSGSAIARSPSTSSGSSAPSAACDPAARAATTKSVR